MGVKIGLLDVVEGKWDNTNKLCELWRAQVCVCISSSDAVAVSEELVQADSACSCGQWNESICPMLEHPHEHVSLAGTDQAQAGQILQGGLSAG